MKSMEMPEIFRNLKRGMGIAGIFFGVIGVVVCIALYFIISPVIDRVEANAVLTMEHASTAVGSVSDSMRYEAESLSSMGRTYQNISEGWGMVEGGFDELASSLRAVSRELGGSSLISENTLRKFNSSADEFSAASSNFKNAKASFSALSNSAARMSSEINSTISSLTSVKNDVEEAKESVRRVFWGLRAALLLGTIAAVLIFLILICYSAGILL